MAIIAEPEALALDNILVDRPDANGERVRILDLTSFTAAACEKVGLRGPSGAGKTTLLDVACSLLPPSQGTVRWGATNLSALKPAARDKWRAQTVGFVFQDFHLVPELSIFENIVLPCTFDHWRRPSHIREAALELIGRLDLPTASRRAGALSRGEQQRVAIARALVREPRLIVADEPTASLDAANARVISELLVAEAARHNATLLIASHDEDLLGRMDRVVALKAGRAETHS